MACPPLSTGLAVEVAYAMCCSQGLTSRWPDHLSIHEACCRCGLPNFLSARVAVEMACPRAHASGTYAAILESSGRHDNVMSDIGHSMLASSHSPAVAALNGEIPTLRLVVVIRNVFIMSSERQPPFSTRTEIYNTSVVRRYAEQQRTHTTRTLPT